MYTDDLKSHQDQYLVDCNNFKVKDNSKTLTNDLISLSLHFTNLVKMKDMASQLVILFLCTLLHFMGDRNGGERMSAGSLIYYNYFLDTYTILRDIIK